MENTWWFYKNVISCEYYNTVKRVGIYRHKSLGTYVKRERQSNGLTKKQEESHYRNRKVERPSKEILSKEIINFSFVSLGKKYGVCDKCIVKWCKYYGLPYRKKDIKNIYNSSSILPHTTITQNNGQGFGKWLEFRKSGDKHRGVALSKIKTSDPKGCHLYWIG